MRVRASIRLVVTGLAGVLATVPANASWYTFHRLIPSPNGSFYFGASMAAVDDRFLVGDPGDDSGGPFTGAVYLVDARTGEILQTIVHPDPQPYAQFGLAVALRGGDVVVGAPHQPVGGAGEVGAVYVFDGATGALRHTLANPTPAAGEYFGGALAASGNDILVGARKDGVPPFPSGAAYVFDGTTGALVRTLTGPSPAAWGFGISVGFVDGDPLVGAFNDSTVAPLAGGAYRFDGATGALRSALHAPMPELGAAFGSRVGAIAGKPVVAAVFDDLVRTDAGAIYLFDETGSAMGAFANPVPDHVEPQGIGQVAFDAIDDRLLAAGFFHYSDLSTPGGDSVHVIDTVNGDVLQTLEGPEPFGTELQATFVIATNRRIVVSSFGQLFVFDPVGNNYLALHEECDDGNTIDGDGCSARALLEVASCPPTPRTDCAAAAAAGARLKLHDRADDRRDALSLRLQSESGAGDLGDPTGATGYGLCLYDASPASQPRRALGLPSGAECVGGTCWRAGESGFTYRDRQGTGDGITSARLRRKAGGGVAAVVTGRGVNLHLPGSLTLPVTVQFARDDGGQCWTATFSAALANGNGVFGARSD
jgi:cysteine-rich repeat protein